MLVFRSVLKTSHRSHLTMKFDVVLRRVLVTTALVAILASSLFSGWLDGSSSNLKTPVAYAQSPDIEKFKKWFSYGGIDKGSNVIRIVVTEDDHAPYIDVYAEEERPKLRFRLTQLLGTGRGLGVDPSSSNKEYYIFTANTVTGEIGSETESPQNLYIISSDETNRGIVVTPQDGKGFDDILADLELNILTKINWGANIFDMFGTGPISIGSSAWELQSFGLNNDSWANFQRYIYINPNPSDRDANCRDNDISTTKVVPGPAPNPVQRLDPPGDQWGSLNANCLNRDSTGWPLKSWGVTVNGSAFEAVDALGPCGVGNLASLDFAKIVTRFISCAVGGIIKTILEPVGDAANSIAGESARLEDRLKGPKDPEDGLVRAWRYSLTLVNALVILALLAIAFANVLHLNLNTYTAKKSLPGLVLGVVGANASLLLMRFILDIVQALMNLSFTIGNAGGLAHLLKKFINILGSGIDRLPLGDALAGGFALFITLIAVVYFICLVIMFGFALIKRTVMLYFLIVVAPLAFVSYGIPTMSQWFIKWWDQFLRNAFVLPILFLAIAIFIQYGDKLGLKPNLALLNSDSPGVGLFSVILAFAAATLILKLPGAITKGAIDLNNISKRAFGYAGQAPGVVHGWGQNATAGISKHYGAKAALEEDPAKKKRLERISKRYQAGSDIFGAARGRAYALSAPQKTFSEWRRKRGEVAEKASIIESLKAQLGAPSATHLSTLITGDKDELKPRLGFLDKVGRFSIANKIQGAPGTFQAAKDFGGEIASKATTIEEVNEILGKGKKAKNLAQAFKMHEDNLGTNQERKSFRGKVIGALRNGALSDVEKLLNEARVPLADRGDEWDKGLVLAHYAGKQRVIQADTRNQDRPNVLTTIWDDVNSINPPPRPFGRPDIPPDRPPDDNPPNPPDGGGAVPSGGPAASGGDGSGVVPVEVVGGTIDKIGDIGLSPEEAGAATARLTDINQHAGVLHDVIDKDFLNGLSRDVNNPEVLESMLGDQAETTKQMLSGLVNTTKSGGSELVSKISEAFADKTGEALQNIVHDMTIAANNRGDTAAMEKHLANSIVAGQGLDAANQNAQAAFNPERQNELYQHIETGNESGIAEMLKYALTPTLTTLNQTLGKVNTPAANQQIFEQMAKELAGLKETLSGRGPRSFSRIIETLGSRMGKQLDVAHLSIASQFKQAMASKSSPATQTPTTQTSEVKVSVENPPSSVAGTAQTVIEQIPEAPAPTPEDQTKQ